MYIQTDPSKSLEFLRPHYSDTRFRTEQTIFCADPKLLEYSYGTRVMLDCHYDYSDRLSEWNYRKNRKSFLVANSEPVKRESAAWFEAYLSHYYGYPVNVLHIIAGVNHGNGYPYTIYGTRRLN